MQKYVQIHTSHCPGDVNPGRRLYVEVNIRRTGDVNQLTAFFSNTATRLHFPASRNAIRTKRNRKKGMKKRDIADYFVTL